MITVALFVAESVLGIINYFAEAQKLPILLSIVTNAILITAILVVLMFALLGIARLVQSIKKGQSFF